MKVACAEGVEAFIRAGQEETLELLLQARDMTHAISN
jgi:hypothetical protein